MLEYNFWRVYNTVNKMLYKRGYHKAKNCDISFEEFCKLDRESLDFKSDSRPDAKIQRGSIYVFFPPSDEKEKIGVKPIRVFKEIMETDEVNRAIMVVREGVTPFAMKEIEASMRNQNKPVYIETFTESELVIDKTEHELVPKHEPLTEQEKQDLLEEFNLKEAQLPKMKDTDPISRYYGLQKGDVVKIERPSETAGTYMNYRLVTGAV